LALVTTEHRTYGERWRTVNFFLGSTKARNDLHFSTFPALVMAPIGGAKAIPGFTTSSLYPT
jgi:hypothetical protein